MGGGHSSLPFLFFLSFSLDIIIHARMWYRSESFFFSLLDVDCLVVFLLACVEMKDVYVHCLQCRVVYECDAVSCLIKRLYHANYG